MRNKYKDEDNRCEGPSCSACLARDLQDFLTIKLEKPEKKWHKFTPGTEPNELTLCEECHEEFVSDFAFETGDPENKELPEMLAGAQSDWAREWCMMNNIVAFVPAHEELRDMGDVREWFECLSRFLAWHCDTSFQEYIFGEGSLLSAQGNQIFTPAECKLLDRAMEKAMKICEMAQRDPYAVGTNSMRAIGALPGIPEQDEKWETSEPDTTPDQNAQLAKIALFVKGIAEKKLESERDIASEDAIAERNQMIEQARAIIESAKAVAKGAK